LRFSGIINKYTNNRFCNTVLEKLERTCTQNDSRQITKNDFKIPTQRKEMFRLTPQKMAGLCYVTPITGHKANTGKEEEEEEINTYSIYESISVINFQYTNSVKFSIYKLTHHWYA
jgi:hypothetical protein